MSKRTTNQSGKTIPISAKKLKLKRKLTLKLPKHAYEPEKAHDRSQPAPNPKQSHIALFSQRSPRIKRPNLFVLQNELAPFDQMLSKEPHHLVKPLQIQVIRGIVENLVDHHIALPKDDNRKRTTTLRLRDLFIITGASDPYGQTEPP